MHFIRFKYSENEFTDILISHAPQLSFPLVPSSPQNVKTQDVSSTSITVIWKPPQNLNGRLQGYEVSYMLNGGSLSVVGVQNTTTWKLTGLKPYTVYTIFVRAKTGAGFGASTCSSVTTLEDGMSIVDGYNLQHKKCNLFDA